MTTKNPKELRHQAKQKIEEAKALHVLNDRPNSSPEQREQGEAEIDRLLTEAEELKTEADGLEGAEEKLAQRRLGKSGRGLDGGLGKRFAERAQQHGIPIDQFLNADEADLDHGGFDSLGQFMRSVRDQQAGHRADSRLGQADGLLTMNQSSTTANAPSGGFLVPSFFQREIIQSVDESRPWLSLIRNFIVPDGVGDVVWPMAADRNRSGEDVAGLALSRTQETGTIPLSALKFKSRRASLTKAATRVKVSNELLEDSAIAMSEIITSLVAEAVAMRMALDILSGTGAGEPLGILNSDALYTVPKESGQSADTITYPNAVNMWSRLAGGVQDRSIWLTHPGAYPQITTMVLPVGTGGSAVFVANAQTDRPTAILGRPLYTTEACKLLGDKGDIVLFDPSKYVHAMRPLRIEASRDASFDTDETEFRIVMRDDGAPLYDQTRTDVRSYESSEFVTLAARA